MVQEAAKIRGKSICTVDIYKKISTISDEENLYVDYQFKEELKFVDV